MTKQARPNTTVSPVDALASFGFAAPAEMEAMMTQYSEWLDDLGRVQKESIDFVRARLARDAEAAARMAACKTPTDLFEWQISYTKDAVEDYLRQGQKLGELFMQATNGHASERAGKGA
jgi:hypothetical protein